MTVSQNKVVCWGGDTMAFPQNEVAPFHHALRGDTMTVYLAGCLRAASRLREVAQRFKENECQVVSSWVFSDDIPEDWYKVASRDLNDLSRARIVVLDTLDALQEGSGGGREFEFATAWATKEPRNVFLVGPVRNAFHTLILPPRRFESWEAFFRVFRSH